MTIAIRPVSSIRRTGLLLVVASVAAFGGLLGSVEPVAACSCAPLGSLKESATTEQAIFSGTAGGHERRGVSVQVDRWFWGQGAAPVVWLAESSFGDGAACGTTPPAEGSRWLWIAWRPGNDGDFGTGLCSPAHDLGTPEGRAVFEEAVAVFNGVAPPPTAEAVTGETVDPATSPDPAAAARDQAAITIIGGLLLGSLAMFGALVLIARRSRSGTDVSG
jgi:hypothetical protein